LFFILCQRLFSVTDDPIIIQFANYCRYLRLEGVQLKVREALLQAGVWIGKAHNVENRIEEPNSLEDALHAPHAHFWKDGLSIMQAYASDPSAATASATAALRALAGQ
jgi:hypothetical protein